MIEHISQWLWSLGPGQIFTGLLGAVTTAGAGFVWLIRLEGRVNGLERTTVHTENALTRLEDKIDKIIEHLISKK